MFWHSSAHVLGEAMERVYGGHLCYGPPIEEGYYYDMYCDGLGVSALDFPGIEDVMKKITKEKQPFERLVMKKDDLLEMFKYNKFKVSDLFLVMYDVYWSYIIFLLITKESRLFEYHTYVILGVLKCDSFKIVVNVCI